MPGKQVQSLAPDIQSRQVAFLNRGSPDGVVQKIEFERCSGAAYGDHGGERPPRAKQEDYRQGDSRWHPTREPPGLENSSLQRPSDGVQAQHDTQESREVAVEQCLAPG